MPNLTTNYKFKKPLANEYARPNDFNDNWDSLDAKLKTVADSVPDEAAVDDTLSGASTNPVQNKVVKAALDGKIDKSGGTMTGTLILKSPAVGAAAGRNIYAGTADMTAGSSALATGDIYIVYE